MGTKDFIRRIVAKTESEITQKPIDSYTISHVLMGIVSFMLFKWFFSSFIFGRDLLWISVLSVFIWAILWEYVENFLLAKTRFKFNNQKDSLENSLTDVVFTGVGGFVPFFSEPTGYVIMAWLIFVILYGWVKK